MKATFQHMFPAINVKSVQLTECRRVVLFHFKKEDGTIEMRHYAIRAKPTGISKTIKRVIESKIPSIGNLTDVSEYIENDLGAASDSEAEDEASRVQLPEKYIGRGNGKNQQSAIKLIELGPRVTMELFKVERGIGAGDILYHKDHFKTPEEAAATKKRIETAAMIKAQRKAEQESNVKRKKEELEARREALKNKKRRMGPHSGNNDDGMDGDVEDDDVDEDDDYNDDGDDDDDDDDDIDNDDDDDDDVEEDDHENENDDDDDVDDE